ncbi:hypothetical protein SESBI_01388 [Sesbania bispinosa]|nr:hypothetical protein SESBI_01388 [Sesbania bispinosa]
MHTLFSFSLLRRLRSLPRTVRPSPLFLPRGAPALFLPRGAPPTVLLPPHIVLPLPPLFGGCWLRPLWLLPLPPLLVACVPFCRSFFPLDCRPAPSSPSRATAGPWCATAATRLRRGCSFSCVLPCWFVVQLLLR